MRDQFFEVNAINRRDRLLRVLKLTIGLAGLLIIGIAITYAVSNYKQPQQSATLDLSHLSDNTKYTSNAPSDQTTSSLPSNLSASEIQYYNSLVVSPLRF